MAARLSLVALGALLTLGPLAAASPALSQDVSPDDAPSARAPEGDDCAGVIARWQDFAGRENRGGHMDTSVYSQIQGETDRADRLCQAGQDAQARRLVAESKRRHGYPQ